MLNKNEAGALFIASLIIGFIISFKNLQTYDISTLVLFLKNVGFALVTVLICMTISKLAAYKFGCNIEFKLWGIERYGFDRKHYLKKPFPAWIAFPLILIFISWGYIKWMALLIFEANNETRIARRKEFNEITEWEIALIAFYGVFANIFMSIVFQILGWNSLASLNIWFAFFNLLPFSELNGMKIISGSMMLWIFSIILTAIMIILLGITSTATTIIASIAVAFTAVVAFFHFFKR